MAILRHFVIIGFNKHIIIFIVKENSKLLLGVGLKASQILLRIFEQTYLDVVM